MRTIKLIERAIAKMMTVIAEEYDYRGSHTAPDRESGVPLHDLTANDNIVYPDDVYSSNGIRYYGSGDATDRLNFSIIQKFRGKPNGKVTIYRAVPPNVDKINPGDWVTITSKYARDHMEGEDGWKILKMTVPAKDIYTNGDSLDEWGYDP